MENNKSVAVVDSDNRRARTLDVLNSKFEETGNRIKAILGESVKPEIAKLWEVVKQNEQQKDLDEDLVATALAQWMSEEMCDLIDAVVRE